MRARPPLVNNLKWKLLADFSITARHVRMRGAVKLRRLPLLWMSFALLIAGCPKRQTTPRIVYVRTPPPAPTQAPAAADTQAMTIEEPPPPPEPEPASQRKAAVTQDSPPPHQHTLRRGPPATTPETPPETVEPQEQPVPPLEQSESHMQQAAQRREIEGLQADVEDRMKKLSRAGLSGVDRKTLDDARTFFKQSTQALAASDLQRALTLARKASLLLSALEH